MEGQFATRFQGTDVVIPGPAGVKGFVRDSQRVLHRLAGNFPYPEGGFANHCLRLKAEVLDDDLVAHLSPGET